MRAAVAVVGVVAAVVLAVAGVGAEVRLTRAKKYHLCTARDVSMLVAELCSGSIGGPYRGMYRRSQGSSRIMTLRSPQFTVRGRRREDDGPPFGTPPPWDSFSIPKYPEEEVDRVEDSAEVFPVWDVQNSNSYEELLAEPGWRGEASGERLGSPLLRLGGGGGGGGDWRRGSAPLLPGLTHAPRGKRQTLSMLRARCCRDGCDEDELYTFCI